MLSSLKFFANQVGQPRPDSLIHGAAAAFAVNCTAVVINFVLQILLARTMGIESYGYYMYVLSWVTVLVLLTTLGLDAAMLRFVGVYNATGDAARLRGILRLSAFAVLPAGLLIAFALAAITAILRIEPEELRTTFFIGAALLPVWGLNNLREYSLRAMKHVLSARVPAVIVRPILICLFVALYAVFFGRASAPIVLTCNLLAAGLTFVLSSWLLAGALSAGFENRAPVYEVAEWFSAALPLLFIAIVQAGLNEVDKIVVGSVCSAEQIGLYAAASRISLFVLFGTQAIDTIAGPLIAEAWVTKDRQGFQRLVSRIARWSGAVSLPLLFVLMLLGSWVLGLFGPQFKEAYGLLLLLCGAQALAILAGPAGFVLTMTGHQRAHANVLAANVAITIILTWAGAVLFGPLGAALGTATGLLLRSLLLWRRGRRLLGVDSSLLFALARMQPGNEMARK